MSFICLGIIYFITTSVKPYKRINAFDCSLNDDKCIKLTLNGPGELGAGRQTTRQIKCKSSLK